MQRFFRYSTSNHNNLEQNPKHKFAQRHALNVYNANAIYSFIPKNACSSLRTTIAHANGLIKDKSEFNWIHNNNSTFIANLSELIKAKYTFTVLRCPFSRLVSSYLDKIVTRDRIAWNYIDVHQRNIDIEDITFEFFVQSMMKPHVRNSDIHWRPQKDFLVYEEYDDYFSLENFSNVENTLKRRLGIKLIDARSLTKHGADQYDFFDGRELWKLKPFEILTQKLNGKIPRAVEMYNDELKNLVINSYKNDIDFYKEKIGSETLMFT